MASLVTGTFHSPTTQSESVNITTSTVVVDDDIKDNLPAEAALIEDNKSVQKRFQQEAVDTAQSIISRILADFGPVYLLGNSPAACYIQDKLLNFLKENKNDLLEPLVLTKPGSLKSQEKTIIKYNLEAFAVFFEDYVAARENFDNKENEPTRPVITLEDDVTEDTVPVIEEKGIPPARKFEDCLLLRRREVNRTLPFADDNTSNDKMYEQLLILSRGCLSGTLEKDPVLAEGLAQIFSSLGIVLIDNIIAPGNICLLIERLASCLEENSKAIKTDTAHIYVDLKQLQEITSSVKRILEAVFKVIELNKTFKNILEKIINFIADFISSQLLTEIEKAKRNEISITPFLILKNIFYTEVNNELKPNVIWKVGEEEKKDLHKGLEGRLENAIRSCIKSSLPRSAPGLISTSISDFCLSLKLHTHLLFLVNNPALLKLLLHDLLSASCKALSDIRNDSILKVTITPSLFKEMDLNALVKEHYINNFEPNNSSTVSTISSSSEELTIESFEHVCTKEAPSLIESSLNKITRLVKDINPSPPERLVVRDRKVDIKEDWIKNWSTSLIPIQNDQKYTQNQLIVIKFTKELFGYILKDYVLKKEWVNSSAAQFARRQILSYFLLNGDLYAALAIIQHPRKIEQSLLRFEPKPFFSFDEKKYLQHILEQSSFFFEGYARALATLRKEETEINEAALLIYINAFRKQSKRSPFDRDVTQEDIYRLLMHLQQALNIIERKRSTLRVVPERSLLDFGREIAIAGGILKLVEVASNPHHILYIIHRISTEDIIWNIGLNEKFPDIPNDPEFLASLRGSFTKIFKSILPLGSSGGFFEKLISFLLSSVPSWSEAAAGAMLHELGELLMSDNTSKPFIMLNFLLYNVTDGIPEPILKNQAPENYYNLEKIQKMLIKRLDDFINDEIDKKNLVDRVLFKTLKAITKSFSENCIKEIIFLTQQPKILRLLLWDLLQGTQFALNEIINSIKTH